MKTLRSKLDYIKSPHTNKQYSSAFQFYQDKNLIKTYNLIMDDAGQVEGELIQLQLYANEVKCESTYFDGGLNKN
jgi:hypothetical protein